MITLETGQECELKSYSFKKFVSTTNSDRIAIYEMIFLYQGKYWVGEVMEGDVLVMLEDKEAAIAVFGDSSLIFSMSGTPGMYER